LGARRVGLGINQGGSFAARQSLRAKLAQNGGHAHGQQGGQHPSANKYVGQGQFGKNPTLSKYVQKHR